MYTRSELLLLRTAVQGSLNRVPLTTLHRLRKLGLCTVPPTKRGVAGGSQARTIHTVVNRSTNKPHCTFVNRQNGVNWSNLRTLHGLHIPVHINRQHAPNVCSQTGPQFTNLVTVPTETDICDLINKCTKTLPVQMGLINAQSVCNKATSIYEEIKSKGLDLLFLTETWLKEHSNGTVLFDLLPEGYSIIHQPRLDKQGGGVAVVHRDTIQVRKHPPLPTTPQSFEALECSIKMSSHPIHAICLYRPPSSPIATFMDEFDNLLFERFLHSSTLMVVGDVNIWMEDIANSATTKLCDILSSFELQQLVTSSTHKKGHTLDIVALDTSKVPVSNLCVHDFSVSDHALISFVMQSDEDSQIATKSTCVMRNFKAMDTVHFTSDVEAAVSSVADTNVNHMVDHIHQVLKQTLDKHAPEKTYKARTRKSEPWISSDILSARCRKRSLEKQMRRTQLAVHKKMYTQQLHQLNHMIKEAKREFFTTRLRDADSSQKELFNTFAQLTGSRKVTALPSNIPEDDLPDSFATFFDDKIAKLRSELDSHTSNQMVSHSRTIPSPLVELSSTTEAEVHKILKSSPVKTCSLDPLPARLFKIVLPAMVPCLVNMINCSFMAADFPACMKSSVITPLIKKQSLDKNCLKNYRPVSGLPFLGKLLERVAASRIHEYLAQNSLYTRNQSAYRPVHSVETALLRITDSILRSVDSGLGVIILLLDLSAAFDTIDHACLVSTLHNYFGIQNKALSWINSYISNRSFCVKVGSKFSLSHDLKYGVPQGSVLGPLLYTAYTAPLAEVIDRHGVNFHFYADDTQLWIPVDFNNPVTLSQQINSLENCVEAISDWMVNMKLKLNTDKTELLVIRSKFRTQPVPDIQILVGNSVIQPASKIRNLGVIFDETLSFDDHISATCQSAYWQLKNINSIYKYLPADVLEGLIHAFVSSKLDFCNSLMYGLPNYQIDRLKKIQHRSARIITRSKMYVRITPIMYRLHWLPVELRSVFKILTLAHRAVYNGNPEYLDVRQRQAPRNTRSASTVTLEPQYGRLRTLGDRAFSVAAPSLWKELPRELQCQDNYFLFKKLLKTHLFYKYYT